MESSQTSLYCVEQIAIPMDLPGILTDWMKSVIRHNPADIYSYSAKYFANLATTEDTDDTDGRVDMSSLKGMKSDLLALDERFSNDAVPLSDVLDVVAKHKFSVALSNRIAALIELNGGVLTGYDFFLLILALGAPNLMAAVELCFAAFSQSDDVYSPVIAADELQRLFEHLHNYDHRVTAQVVTEVSTMVEDNNRQPMGFGDFLKSNVGRMLQ